MQKSISSVRLWLLIAEYICFELNANNFFKRNFIKMEVKNRKIIIKYNENIAPESHLDRELHFRLVSFCSVFPVFFICNSYARKELAYPEDIPNKIKKEDVIPFLRDYYNKIKYAKIIAYSSLYNTDNEFAAKYVHYTLVGPSLVLFSSRANSLALNNSLIENMEPFTRPCTALCKKFEREFYHELRQEIKSEYLSEEGLALLKIKGFDIKYISYENNLLLDYNKIMEDLYTYIEKRLKTL